MVIIGSRTIIEGKGTGLIVALAKELEAPLGPVGRYAFLAGAWAAIMSSLLGVWQSVPYIYADFWKLVRGKTGKVSTDSRVYRYALYLLASVPA